jgi:hypothetical protein
MTKTKWIKKFARKYTPAIINYVRTATTETQMNTTYTMQDLIDMTVELKDLIAIQKARSVALAEPSAEVEARITEIEAILEANADLA